MIQPYAADHLNTLYNQLFCDDLSAYTASLLPAFEYPWTVLLGTDASVVALKKIATDPQAASRTRLLAWRRLAATGETVPSSLLLGVIIEVGMDGSTDTLAAFKDGSAQYINHSEKLIVWDHPTRQSDTIIAELFQQSEQVIAQIGPWKEARMPAPGDGEIRLNFLTADGLYFGQGPFSVLQRDAMGGPVISAGVALLQLLTTAASES